MFSDKSINAVRRSIESGAPELGPSDIQILPTPRCNARCSFCPLHAIPEPLMKETPRFNTYKEDLPGGLLDRLADDLYYLGGLKRVTVTGGEPLLYSHLVPMIFQFSMTFPEVELTIVTNGIRLKSFASFFARAQVANVSISLNAASAESYMAQNPGAGRGAFDEALAGVAALMEAKKKTGAERPRVGISAVLTSASARDVEGLFEIGREHGVDAVTFLPLMELRLSGGAVNTALKADGDLLSRFKDDVDCFGARAAEEGFYLGYACADERAGAIDSGDLYSRQPCYAGQVFAAIYPNGDVRPCCHCEPIMGNLKEESFIDIWRGPRYAAQRKSMLEIASRGRPDGCLCGECGYCHENREIHRLLGEG